jgi:hypothetical protein
MKSLRYRPWVMAYVQRIAMATQCTGRVVLLAVYAMCRLLPYTGRWDWPSGYLRPAYVMWQLSHGGAGGG